MLEVTTFDKHGTTHGRLISGPHALSQFIAGCTSNPGYHIRVIPRYGGISQRRFTRKGAVEVQLERPDGSLSQLTFTALKRLTCKQCGKHMGNGPYCQHCVPVGYRP